MRISDWSSDVCSSDLAAARAASWRAAIFLALLLPRARPARTARSLCRLLGPGRRPHADQPRALHRQSARPQRLWPELLGRSEEHTSELQSLMRISYAVFCLQNKNKHTTQTNKRHLYSDTQIT